MIFIFAFLLIFVSFIFPEIFARICFKKCEVFLENSWPQFILSFFLVWVQLCGSFVIVALSCTVIGLILIITGLKHKRRQERKMKLYGAAGFVAFVGSKIFKIIYFF